MLLPTLPMLLAVLAAADPMVLLTAAGLAFGFVTMVGTLALVVGTFVLIVLTIVMLNLQRRSRS